MGVWQVLLVEEVAAWFDDLTKNDPDTANQVEDAVDRLAAEGPAFGGRWSTESRAPVTTT
jgi:hypothetical protein